MSIKSFLLKITGIGKWLDKIKQLEVEHKRLSILCDQMRQERDRILSNIDYVNADHKLILDHIKFLNSNFFVGADISAHISDPSVILVMKKGKENIIKTYYFHNEALKDIHHILEGFGKDNVIIDAGRFSPSPKYRY